MELRSFIGKSIQDIYLGVEDAQKSLPEGAVVPPAVSSFRSVETGISERQVIRFEVLVRVDEQKGKAAKVSVVTGLLGGGMNEKSSSDHGHSATLKFSVPISLPISLKIQKTDQ
jgi:hypothetical protein